MVYVVNWCGSRCGGTLIRKTWVLTAAHCLDDIDMDYFWVTAGHHIGAELQKQIRDDKRYIKHPGYVNGLVINDIGLLQLDSPFVINSYVRLACLPPPGYIVPVMTYCVATGWGYRNDSLRGLKQVVLPVRSYVACMKTLGNDMKDKTQMCAGSKEKGHDTCKGDSDRPLICLLGEGNKARWTLQGVTSWSYELCHKGGYGGYTRVSKYMDWIFDNIGNSRGA